MILQDCDSCGIYTLEGKYLYTARVYYNNNVVKLYFDGYNHQDMRSDYEVVFFDNKAGELHILCQLVVHRNPEFPRVPEPWMADCRLQHLLRTVKPERGAKVRLHKEVIFRMEDGVTFYGTIREMNVEGMRVTTFQPMNKNQRLAFTNPFKPRMGEIEAVAVRAKKQEDGSFLYECQFSNLSQEHDEAIQDYVRRQLINRSIRKS